MVPAKYFLLSKYFPPSALQLLRSHFLKDSKLFLKKLGVNFANNGLNTFLDYSGEIAAFHANGTHFTR